MDIFSQIGRKPIRTQPGVWVSRMVIFSTITTKEQTIIRDIPLSQGMNIIWAKSLGSSSAALDVAGHSAGKTTFCRFIRYALGEKTFSTKPMMAAIRREFPSGYVAAEIYIRGKKWAVRRPIGDGRVSYISPDVTIEELLAEKGESVFQEEYTERLGLNAILDSMETSQIVQTSESILWDHVLAWCSRDQESRFQSLHGWRNSQSDSGTPSFQSPRFGPLAAIRAILGLYLPEELKDEEILADMNRRKEKLEKQLEKSKEEPQFRVALYERHLKDLLKNILPEAVDIDDLPYSGQTEFFRTNLVGLAAQAQASIDSRISSAEQELNEAEEAIGKIQGQIWELDRQREQIDGLYELAEKGGRESNPDLTERQGLRKRYEEQKNNRCPYGQIFIRDCPVVLERQQVLQMNEIQDAHFMEQTEAKCSEAIREINAELAGIEKRKAELTRDLGSEKDARSKAQNDLYKARQDGDELAKILNEHERWSNWHYKPDEYRELHKLRASLDELSRNITLVESTLAELLKAHNYSRETLSTICHNLVKVVLPGARFDGKVRLDGGEISFCINRNGKIGGEAISTLSVLLADMSALIFTIVSEQSHLPGFLMHDSPREADMDYAVYHSYIRTWGGLQSEFPVPVSCPFQYIITTTSEPPKEFRTEQYLKLELDASTPEGLLLKCVVDNRADDIFVK